MNVDILAPGGRKVSVEIPLGCLPVKAGELTRPGDLFLQGGRHGLDGREPRWLDCIEGQRVEESAIVARPARRSK